MQLSGPDYQQMLANCTEGNKGLFDIGWRDSGGAIRKLVLTKEYTGVEANIIVLLGSSFPSGSHKVGPAYSIYREAVMTGEISKPGTYLVAPSTGNFAIGVAYVAQATGHKALIVMPEGMAPEKFEVLEALGAQVEKVPELDLKAMLKRAHALAREVGGYVMPQFESFANYRFHRYVTGKSAIEAAQAVGNGKIACFVSAPGSGGTLAAGDELKHHFGDTIVVAVEPLQSPILALGKVGEHLIEGVGDGIITLVHNGNHTDYITLIDDVLAVRGLKAVTGGAWGPSATEVFGISGVANVIAAIRMAKFLNLGAGENLVTVATDGFDRYGTALEKVEHQPNWQQLLEQIVVEHIFDFRQPEAKQKLFTQKCHDWEPFGYSADDLQAMTKPEFWEQEYRKVEDFKHAKAE